MSNTKVIMLASLIGLCGIIGLLFSKMIYFQIGFETGFIAIGICFGILICNIMFLAKTV